MYLERNIVTPSCNYCCSGKAKNIKYYEGVPTALDSLRQIGAYDA